MHTGAPVLRLRQGLADPSPAPGTSRHQSPTHCCDGLGGTAQRGEPQPPALGGAQRPHTLLPAPRVNSSRARSVPRPHPPAGLRTAPRPRVPPASAAAPYLIARCSCHGWMMEQPAEDGILASIAK
ncbi:uncharacterized protein LOC144365595 [Ictidomys tridecemlineatus]